MATATHTQSRVLPLHEAGGPLRATVTDRVLFPS